MKQVYFLRPKGFDGPIKIGCSRDPENRLYNCTLWSPVELEMVASVPGDHCHERAIHRLFADDRLRSEWFRMSVGLAALIAFVKETGALPAIPQKERGEAVVFDEARAEQMRARFMKGETLKSIGKDYNLTRERVRQILHRLGVTAKTRAAERRKALAA